MDKQIPTGIKGLDKILKGGIRERSSILISGAPGTGKTIMAMQFIYEGAKMGVPGIYISSEEQVENLRMHAKEVGMDFEGFEKKGLITLIQQPILAKKLISIATPLDVIKKKKVKRVVLDSLTLFQFIQIAGLMDYRKEVLDFVNMMHDAGVTLLTTSERPENDIDEAHFKQEDFLYGGLILLTKIRKGSSFERCLNVAKMRGQDHLTDIYPYTINKGGIKVYPDQVPFSLIEHDVAKKDKLNFK
jgi:KaiC/GvpD/RAD55 family RecA-like ATPase